MGPAFGESFRLRRNYGVASEQMKRDIASGKLGDALRGVEEDIKAGRVREMP